METKFYHHILNNRGEKEPKDKKVAIQKEETNEWRRKIYFSNGKRENEILLTKKLSN